jgi:hypothetical protein
MWALFARLRRLIRRVSIFGVEVEFHPPPPDPPAAAPGNPAPAPLPASAATPAAPPGQVTVRGTSPNRRTPRELSMSLAGGDLHLMMHPPGRPGSQSITLSAEEVGRGLRAAGCTLGEPGTTRQLLIVSHEGDSADVRPGEIRVQLGTTNGQWWMYCAHRELWDALRRVGVSLPE